MNVYSTRDWYKMDSNGAQTTDTQTDTGLGWAVTHMQGRILKQSIKIQKKFERQS